MTGAGRRWTARRATLVAVALYVALAVASTWPLARRAATTLPLGTDTSATVPLVSAWALGWTADRVPHGLAGYWAAPIFHPTDDAFALSEPMPLVGLVMAPVTWLGGAALAHNLWLLLALVLDGVALRGLARAVGAGPRAALLAGAGGVLLPFAHNELGVLALVPVFGIAWTLQATLAVARAPSARRGALLGIAVGVTYLICAQTAVFVVLAAAAPAAWRLRRGLGARATWIAAAAGPAVAGALILPVAVAQARATARHDLTRTTDRIASGGATGWSWLRAPAQRAVTVPTVKVADEGQRSLFPGWLALGLTGVALAGVRRRRRDGAAGSTTPATTETTSAATSATTTTCDVELIAWTGAAAVVLSLAPRIPGIAAAMHHTPGLAQIRSFWRIGAVAHVVIAILLALGAEALAARWRDRPRRVAAAWVVGALAVIELWPAPQRLAPVPDRADHAALLAWLDRDVAADAPLAVLPGPSSGHVEDFEAEARAMYVGLWHHHPLTGGYSSYFPAEHDALYRDLRGFPSKKATAALRAVGVDHVLADAAWLDGGGRRQRLAGAGWRVAFHDDQLGVDGLVATAAASSGSEVDRDVEDGADPERLPGHR